ncbi:hypothetical protein Tco_1237800 [Tanacetum coccineum]
MSSEYGAISQADFVLRIFIQGTLQLLISWSFGGKQRKSCFCLSRIGHGNIKCSKAFFGSLLNWHFQQVVGCWTIRRTRLTRTSLAIVQTLQEGVFNARRCQQMKATQLTDSRIALVAKVARALQEKPRHNY